jgi:hypothetical protein
MANPRTGSGPRIFGMIQALEEEDLPYEWEGFCPLDGDAVERYGVVTTYTWLRPHQLEATPEYAPHGLHVAMHDSGHFYAFAANEHGHAQRLLLGHHGPGGERVNGDEFEHQRRRLRWAYESIRDVTADGREYTWEATVCVPADADHRGTMWSPAYAARSRRLRRTSANTARHERRVRVAAATTERFDPDEVYDRDGWACRLCTLPVDRDLAWPDPLCASLDHVIPLVAGGEHSKANTQLAHWICNVRKGAKTN